MLLSDGWARAHSTLPAFLVVEQQQSPHTAHSEALSKSVWMHLLLCKHSTAHQESSPKESGEQGGCCVKLHFPDKKKKTIPEKATWHSFPSEPP